MADNNSYLSGSICLSDIPKELIKKVTCKDGKVRSYLNIAIMAKRESRSFANNNGTTRTYTHYITCAPPKDQRVGGMNYFIGDLETRYFNGAPTPQANNYPAAPLPPSGPSGFAPTPPGMNGNNSSEDLPF